MKTKQVRITKEADEALGLIILASGVQVSKTKLVSGLIMQALKRGVKLVITTDENGENNT